MSSAREIISMIKKVIEPLTVNIRLIVSRAVLESVNDSTGIQTVKISLLADEVKEVERMQNYGFTSNPIAESAEGVCIFAGGDREHGICIALDDRTFRLKGLGAGQAALYDSLGNKILMRNDGQIDVVGSVKVNILSPLVDIGSGAKEAVLNGLTFQTGYNLHVHTIFGIPTEVVTVPSPPTDLSLAVKAAKVPV